MIKFSINKTLFLQALNATKRAIGSKNAMEILSTIKIEVSKEGITLTGSNGEISIENFISIDNENAGLLISSTGGILLEANFFISVISSLPELTLDVEEIEQQQIKITSGKSEITLKGKEIDLYPHIAEIDTSMPLRMKTRVLKEVISETVFATSTQENRPILTGVHFTLTDKVNLKAVATDSHRLSQRSITLENEGMDFDVVIPARSLKELSAVFSEEIEEIEVFFATNQLLFRSEHISFYTRILEGIYPDTNRLLNMAYETEVVFKTSNLQHAMERSYLISHLNENGNVKLEITNSTVRAMVNSPEVGKVDEEIDMESVEGSNLVISFNPTYLIAALKAIKSETVKIRFVSSVRPFTLLPGDEGEDFIQLITPVRTN